MNENTHGSRELHPLIISPKYGQTGNVKPLTANCSLSFAVKWPNLFLKVSIIFVYINRFMYIHVFCDPFKLFRADRTKTGHALGPPDSRPTTPEPQRNLNPIICSLLRIIMHSAMVMGACRNPQVTILELYVYWIWSSGSCSPEQDWLTVRVVLTTFVVVIFRVIYTHADDHNPPS